MMHMSFATPQSKGVKQLCCTFFSKTLFRNNSVKQNVGWKAKIKRRGGENGTGTNVTSYRRHVAPSTDCHQMIFLTAARKAARIIISNLRHRQGLPLTRPAVSRPHARERRKSSLNHVDTLFLFCSVQLLWMAF